MIAGYVGGLALLAYELQHTPSLPPPPSGKPTEALPPLEVPPTAIKSIAIYDAILERPLFTRERRPEEPNAPKAEVASAAEPVENIDGFRLTAVLKGLGHTTALIQDQTGKTRLLHAGGRLGKWELKEIQDDRVVLHSDAREETLLVHRFDPVTMQKKAVRRPPGTRRIPRRRLPPPVAAKLPPPVAAALSRPDGSGPDRGEPDNGEPDSGEPDSGEPESGEPDNGGPDDGQPTDSTDSP